jgi:hypothetical protein
MTVAELIEKLQRAPNQQAAVEFSMDDRERDYRRVFVVTSGAGDSGHDDTVYLQNYRYDGLDIEL